MMIDTQDDVLTALIQLKHAAETLKHVQPELLDSVMVGCGSHGIADAGRVIDVVAFDLRIAQVRLENYRAARSSAAQTAG